METRKVRRAPAKELSPRPPNWHLRNERCIQIPTMGIWLADLARAAGIDQGTANRWASTGLVRTRNTGRGNGHGNMIARAAAIEFLALASLRRAGVPLAELRRIARRLRQEGREGPAFLALGADGRTVLLDGAGDDAPLRTAGGQGVLFAHLDLRRLRTDIVRLVDQLEVVTSSEHPDAS